MQCYLLILFALYTHEIVGYYTEIIRKTKNQRNLCNEGIMNLYTLFKLNVLDSPWIQTCSHYLLTWLAILLKYPLPQCTNRLFQGHFCIFLNYDFSGVSKHNVPEFETFYTKIPTLVISVAHSSGISLWHVRYSSWLH